MKTDHVSRFEASESGVRSYCRDLPNLFVSASGARVWDCEGVEFIDFLAGCGSLNYGHNHPQIKQALIDYLMNDGICNALDFHTGAKMRFIETFNDVILRPRHLDYRMQFTGPTGANCVEAALKLARKATGRHNVVAFTNAFHGMSSGALAVTGSKLARSGVESGLNGVTRLAFEGYSGAGLAELQRFATMVSDPSGGVDPVAAIVVETIQGEGGLNVASVTWLRELRALASEMGALLIVDEIQTGCGRTGDFFSFERAAIVPDIVCLSKSIGAGLPMSLLLMKPEWDIWRPAEHSGTFRGHNLAFVAASAALELWGQLDFVTGIGERSRILSAWTREMSFRFPLLISRQKGLGMMAGLEFRSSHLAEQVVRLARRKRVILERCGPHDEVLKIFAPLNIEDNLFREGLDRVTAAIVEVAADGSETFQPQAA
jgi:diaminobutyrate-2-oxoglutarate transaminase